MILAAKGPYILCFIDIRRAEEEFYAEMGTESIQSGEPCGKRHFLRFRFHLPILHYELY